MGFIPDNVIAQVLERSDIVEVISMYIPLKRAGRNLKANCPFHNEKTPSFVVSPEKQIFHCFGCAAGGNVITFIMQQEHIDFPEAVRFLANKFGIMIPEEESSGSKQGNLKSSIHAVNALAVDFFHQILMTDKSPVVQEARGYLTKRGIPPETVKQLKIGFALDRWDSLLSYLKKQNISLDLMEKSGVIIARENNEGYYDRFRNRVMFPIWDIKHQCIGFGARTIKEDGTAKYINSPETAVYTKGHHLYGLNISKDEILRQDAVIIVEGYMDFIMPFQSGVKNIVASLGTALTLEQIKLIRRYTKNVVMLFDADQAGESAMLRSFDLLIDEGMNVKIPVLAQDNDPDSFIRKFGVDAFQERINNAQSVFDFKLNNLMAKHDFSSIEGKAKISMEMITMINRFENEVLKSGYIKRLATKLFVSEEALLIELNKLQFGLAGRSTIQTNPTERDPMVFNIDSPAELNIVRVLLESTELIQEMRAEISSIDFQDAHLKVIISKIFELSDRNEEINYQNLMGLFKDQQILQKISRVMMMEDLLPGDKVKMLRDCIERIKANSIKSEMKELTRQIQMAEAANDDHQLKELREKFNQLILLRGKNEKQRA